MNVLFVGNEDILGKYTAKRFFNEGNKIFWLTEQQRGQLWDSRVNGKIYRMPFENAKCQHVFSVNDIDIVIFMTGSYRDQRYNQIDQNYVSLLPSLMNILNLSKHFDIKRFIFLSSIELYSNTEYPNSEEDSVDGRIPILTDLISCELMCKSWNETMGLPLVILRLSSIYGVDKLSNMGYIGTMVKEIHDHKISSNLLITKNTGLDLLHCEDAADALFRVCIEQLSGIYNVCSGYCLNVSKCFAIITKSMNSTKRLHLEADRTGTSNSITANTNKLRAETGWVAVHDFKEEIKPIIEESLSIIDSFRHNKKRTRKANLGTLKTVKRILPYIENIAMFLAMTFCLNLMQDNADLKLVDLRLIYVIIVSTFFGIKQGSIAVGLASLSYINGLLSSGKDIYYLLYNLNTWFPIIIFMVVGISIGYIFEKKEDRIKIVNNEISGLKDQFGFMKKMFTELDDIKSQLQKQILITKDSYGRVYAAAKQLDKYTPDEVIYESVSIFEQLFETNNIAIYSCVDNNDHFSLKACSIGKDYIYALDLGEMADIKEKITKDEIYVNRELRKDYPTYAAPIFDGNDLSAIIMINNMEMEKFNKYFQNILKVYAGLVQIHYVKALRFNELSYANECINNTYIYSIKEFKNRLKIIKNASEKVYIPYTRANIESKNCLSSPEDVESRLKEILKKSDLVGKNEKGNYSLVLTPICKSDIYAIQKNIENNGFRIEWEEILCS